MVIEIRPWLLAAASVVTVLSCLHASGSWLRLSCSLVMFALFVVAWVESCTLYSQRDDARREQERNTIDRGAA